MANKTVLLTAPNMPKRRSGLQKTFITMIFSSWPAFGQRGCLPQFCLWPQAAPTLNRIAIDPIFAADLILTFSCGYLLSNLFFQLLAVVQHSFLPDITIPPDVVLLFSYIRGLFVYCPFLLVRFIRNVLLFSPPGAGGVCQNTGA